MNDTVGCSYFEFAAKFCNELDKKKNCIFSPLLAAEITISAKALGSIIQNADGSEAVKISSNNNIPLPSILMSPRLKLIKGSTFYQASKVYLNVRHYKVDEKQKKNVKDIFNVKIKNVDMAKAPSTADLINKWVEKKTKENIKGFFKYNDFDVNMKVILVQGLHFKGVWRMKFKPDNTEETIFYLNNNETVNVFLMHRKAKYNYKDSPELDAQLLLLPFKSKQTHMLIVLPKRVTGLDGVLQRLAAGYDLMAEVQEMSNYEVEVRIPTFKVESEMNLVEVLRKLGVTTVFDKAVQKVVIDINEEGTEPKPERMTCGFIPRWQPRPIEFTADRPYLIVITYENMPIIWVVFRGRFD